MRNLMLFAGLMLASCADTDDTDTLQLATDEATDAVTGTFEHQGARVDFHGAFVADQVLELVYELQGMAVTVIVDYKAGVMESDGFAADTGESTQMLDADRELLAALAIALDRPDSPEVLMRLRTMAGMMAEYPTGKDLQFQVFLNTEHGNGICGLLNTYQAGTHDGWLESNWSDKTTIDFAYISTHGACNAGSSDSDAQTTNFWYSSRWNCAGEPDHPTDIEYAYGDCLGRCGAGCSATNVYSWSCLDHDVCNRFGHSWAASLPGGHCADELASAVAEAISEPSCW